MSVKSTRDERENLLRSLSAVSFAVNEAVLYLDTHPDDPKAKAYLDRRIGDRQKALMQYEERYGALLIDDLLGSDDFNWVCAPMPWERGGN